MHHSPYTNADTSDAALLNSPVVYLFLWGKIEQLIYVHKVNFLCSTLLTALHNFAFNPLINSGTSSLILTYFDLFPFKRRLLKYVGIWFYLSFQFLPKLLWDLVGLPPLSTWEYILALFYFTSHRKVGRWGFTIREEVAGVGVERANPLATVYRCDFSFGYSLII